MQKIKKEVTKPYIPVVNAPTQIKILVGQTNDKVAEESKAHLNHGRPFDSKDKNPRKKKKHKYQLVKRKLFPRNTKYQTLHKKGNR